MTILTAPEFSPAEYATVITAEMVERCIVDGVFSTAELEKIVAYGTQILHERRNNDSNKPFWAEWDLVAYEIGDEPDYDEQAEQAYSKMLNEKGYDAY